MKTLTKILAGTGLVFALSVGGAMAQGSSNSGTGTAAQKDMPSTAGATSTGAKTMGDPMAAPKPMKMKKMKKKRMMKKKMM